ncbi:MAG: S41 family peptidase, partial [Sphingomonas sp.]
MTIAAAGHARRSILVGLGAAALAPALLRAQTAASPFPTRADLAGDVAILRAALAMHPGLYRYNTPAQMAARLGGFAAAFTGGTSTEQRYLILARFLATIRCGHSYPNFFNQSKAVTAALFDRTTRLPFDFAWIGGDMVVLGAPAPLALPPGSRISTINGERASHLLARLMPYIRADGSNDGKRIALLEMRNTDTIETFDVFQGLIAPPLDGIHHVRGITPGGAAFALDLPAIGLAARRAAMEKISDDGDEVRWQWAMRGDGVAVLTMPGWALYNSKWNWQAWLDERLDSLAGAKGLVIDLRDNEGGNDCGDAILARLIDRPLAPPGYVQKLRFERTPPALDRYLDTWDDSFRTLGVGGKR